MSNYFFDSSALVKRYNAETGTNWMLQIYRPSSKNIIYISQITKVEVTSALTRRLKGQVLSSNYQRAVSRFERDIENRFLVSKISDKIINEAVGFAKLYSLRGYDAVQLSCAVQIEKDLASLGFPPLIFVSADKELNVAAQSEGFTVENPNNYP